MSSQNNETLRRARVARLAVPKEGSISINHSGLPQEDKFAPAYDYLSGLQPEPGKKYHLGTQAHNVFPNKSILKRILNPDSTWNRDYLKGREGLPEFDLNQSSSRILYLLGVLLSPQYNFLNNPSLNSIYERGFNKHDEDHVTDVLSRATQLLEMKYRFTSVSPEEQERAKTRLTAATYIHDVGNWVSRTTHSLVAWRILNKVLPDLRKNEKQSKERREVRRAIQLHDEPVMAALLNSEAQRQGIDHWFDLSSKQITDLMQEHVGDIALCLFISDKEAINRRRISPKPGMNRELPDDKLDLDKDVHLNANLQGYTKGNEVSSDGKVLTWHLEYNPIINGKELELGAHLRVPSREGYRALTPRKVRERFEQENVSYFRSWQEQLWMLYFERMRLTVAGAFALFDTVETFQIKFSDMAFDDLDKDFIRKHHLQSENIYTFHRETMMQDVKRIADELHIDWKTGRQVEVKLEQPAVSSAQTQVA